MKQPFEGLFGDTCESRILQFLLPMYGIEFEMAELTEEIKLTRQSISKVMKKFESRGMVKSRKVGRSRVYSINEESSLVKRIEDLDNALIESILGHDEFKKMHEAYAKRVSIAPQKTTKQENGSVLIKQDVSGGLIKIDFQNLGWSDERQKSNPITPQSPSQNTAYPPICAGSEA